MKSLGGLNHHGGVGDAGAERDGLSDAGVTGVGITSCDAARGA